jgi:hypothetical protein
MLHNFALALCSIAALAVVAEAIRAIFGAKHATHSTSAFGHAVQHPLEQYLAAERYRMDNKSGSAYSLCPAQEDGWLLIERTLRARRGVRLAVR